MNCRNCGGNSAARLCEYCGTESESWTPPVPDAVDTVARLGYSVDDVEFVSFQTICDGRTYKRAVRR